jgi:hypothetical protein
VSTSAHIRALHLPALAPLALAALCACGNPDNQVVGGLLGSGSVPNAVINDVASSIFGPGTATDLHGNTVATNVVLMTDQGDLCNKLAKDPNYLRSPTENFVALVMLSPQREVGTYYMGQTNIGALLLTTAAAGQTVYGFPAANGGTINIASMHSAPGGMAEGNFAVQVYDPSNSQSSLYTVYGQFKASECPAIANAYVPIYQ